MNLNTELLFVQCRTRGGGGGGGGSETLYLKSDVSYITWYVAVASHFWVPNKGTLFLLPEIKEENLCIHSIQVLWKMVHGQLYAILDQCNKLC